MKDRFNSHFIFLLGIVIVLFNYACSSGEYHSPLPFPPIDVEPGVSEIAFQESPAISELASLSTHLQSLETYAHFKYVDSTQINLQEMVLVYEGDFIMGDSKHGSDRFPAHRVHINSFFMDRYEVDNASYCAFLNATQPDSFQLTRWIQLDAEACKIKLVGTEYRLDPAFEHDPVVMVSWAGAHAFATWAGKRLPTEAEWEFAAKGGSRKRKQFTYIGSDQADQIAWYRKNSHFQAHPIGKLAPNTLGIYDLAGNVSEWCADYYQDDYYHSRIDQAHLAQWNPQGPKSGKLRSIRGGSWMDSHNKLKANSRGYASPELGQEDIGFRCVKNFLGSNSLDLLQ